MTFQDHRGAGAAESHGPSAEAQGTEAHEGAAEGAPQSEGAVLEAPSAEEVPVEAQDGLCCSGTWGLPKPGPGRRML